MEIEHAPHPDPLSICDGERGKSKQGQSGLVASSSLSR